MSEYIEHDKDHISVGLVEKKYFTFANPNDKMILEHGSQLGPVTLMYETYGTLTPKKDNVILIFTCAFRRFPCGWLLYREGSKARLVGYYGGPWKGNRYR